MRDRVWTRGSTVANGELQYVSPSAIVSADHESYGGCLRRFHFRRVMGKPEPEGASAKVGIQGHGETEEYLLTGKMVLGRNALKAKRFFPAPSSSLKVEVPIDDGRLTAAGLPVVGFIDWLNDTGIVLLDDETRREDLDEVVDWKFTGRRDLPSSHEVGTAIPMVTYGAWSLRRRPAPEVRLSHVYIPTRSGDATKRSIKVPAEQIAERWERAEGVVRRMKQAARCTSPEEVDANLNACDAYGGCPHRSYCTAGTQRTLVDLLGPLGAAALLKEKPQPMTTTTSLLNIPALAAAKAALLAEEAAARPTVPPDVKAAVEFIASHAATVGTPNSHGTAAQAWVAVTGGGSHSGNEVLGAGHLATVRVDDPARFPQLAGELAQALGVTWQAPASTAPVTSAAPAAPPAQSAPGSVAVDPAKAMGLIPPDAPVSDPVKALAAMEAAKAPAAQAAPVVITTPSEVRSTTTTERVGEFERTTTVTTATPVAEEPPDAGGGELKLSKKARTYVDGLLARIKELEAQPRIPSGEIGQIKAAVERTVTNIFVDCIPPGPFQDLGPWVHEQAKRLADRFGAPDIRMAANDTPLGFGKWPAALSALVRDAEHAPLPVGDYFLDTRGSQICEAAIDALRTRGQVTRGIR